MNPNSGGPLRILRTLIDADHALVFAKLADGEVALVAADPPQLPSQPFTLDDPSLWPGELWPTLLTEAEQIQRSPLGWMLAGARGTVLAVSTSIIVSTEQLPAGTTALATYLLWQEPHAPPPQVFARTADVALVMREHLVALQQYAEYMRSGTRLSVLLEALPHGVVLTDEQSGAALVNAAASQLLDIPPGVADAPTIAMAMERLHERMSNAGEVKLDGRALFAHGSGARINWVWEVMHPERRTLLVSTLPVRAPGHYGRLWSFHDVTALRAAEAEQARLVRQLERERARVNELLTTAPAMILLLRGPEHVIEFANDAMRDIAGGIELVGLRMFRDYLPGLRGTDFAAAHDEVYHTGQPWNGTGIHFTSTQLDGRPERYCNVSLQPARDADGNVTGIFLHSVDVTAQVSAIEQLRQAQKIETIGRLTGGVAHDFNNLLTVIGGNTELLLAELTPTSQAHADATEVRDAVRRASDLTRQLLSFSRRQVLQRHVVELDQVVHGVEKLLRRVIGEDVVLTTRLGAGDATVMVDAGHLEQVLVNLAVNARDAMPTGGQLTITTSVQLTLPASVNSSLRGPHARLAVSDSGHGMDEATLTRATDPFFTTKPVGKGTGLGLATVKDIIEQSGGALWIDSTPGVGTNVWLALPLAAGGVARLEPPVPTPTTRRAGTLLLVEDEGGVRNITQRILEEAGYVVHVANDGADGLRKWLHLTADEQTSVDCVITDVVMPAMSGRAMVQEMRARLDGLAVLYVSGYVEDGLADEELVGRTAFLAKPFTSEALLAEVAALLDRD